MPALKIRQLFYPQNYVNGGLCLLQQKNYTAVWDKIKAKSYQIPHDSHALQHAKSQKIILSNVSSVLKFVWLIMLRLSCVFPQIR